MKRLLQRDSTENDFRELRNLSPNAFLSHAPTNSEAARIITEHATNGVNSSKKHGKSTNQSRKQDDKNYPSGIGSSNFYSRTLSTQAIQSNPNSSQKKQQNNKGGAKKVRIVQNSQNSGASSSQSSIAQVVHAVSNQAVINNSLPSLSDLASIDNTLVNNRLRPATLNPDPPSGNFGCMNDNSNNEDYTMNMYPSDLDATFYEVMDYATGFNATHAVATSSGENLQHYSAVSNYENLEMCSGQNGEVLHNGEILQTDENGYVISGHNFVTYANHGPSCDDCGKPCQCSEEAHASGYGCFSSAGTPSNFVSSFADTTSNSASDSENTRLEIALGSVDSPGNDDSYGRGEGEGEGKSQPLIINGRIVECVVCGDKSSGKHYGQFTCEGCKSFFKRSVRRGLSYACRSNGLCPVDQQNRNQCQGCRLAKCMQVGMRKEAVQRGRILASPSPRPLQLTSSNYQDPNSPHRYHPQNQINQHVPSSTSSSQHLAMFNRGSNMSRSMSSSDHNSLNSPYYGHQNGAMNGSSIRNERQAYHRQEMDHQRRLECNSPLESDSGLSNGRSLNPGLVYGNYSDLVSMLLKAEPPTACTRFNQSCSPSGLTSPSKSGQGQLSKTPIQSNHGGSSVIRGGDECGRGHSVETVCEMAARLLFCAVQWASSIPYFPQLPLNDQVALLRLTWSEMFVLNAAQCYLPLISLSQNNNNISSTSSNQTSIPNKRTNNISNSSSNGTSKHTNGTTSQNNTKQDSHSSLAEKKELLSNQIRLLEEQVEKLQNLNVDDAEYSCLKCIVLFTPDAAELSDDSHIESIQEKATLALEEYISLTYPDQQGRMGKLLLRLPALRSIGAPVVEHMYFERLVGKTAIDTLIKDMLLSGTNYNWGP